MRVISEAQRRIRLGIRHGLAQPVSGPVEAARAVLALHATEPTTVYLSAYARSGATQDETARALYDDRSLIKQLAMRRTVFAFPGDVLPAALGSAAARVAKQQHDLVARSVTQAGISADGSGWVDDACGQTLQRVRSQPASTAQLRAALPILQQRLPAPERARNSRPTLVASRVLTVLAARGAILRGPNDGDWTTARPIWTATEDWLGYSPQHTSTDEGYQALVRHWLWAYGPGTEADLVWWLGATKAATRGALTQIGAVAVQLEDGTAAWLHPDDSDDLPEPPEWTALLPTLDPTTMGWRDRRFYLAGTNAGEVYDIAGNGRTTAWWNGRIVGRWEQQSDSSVVVQPTVDLPAAIRRRLDQQASALTDWLNGSVIRSSLQGPISDS